MTAVANLTLFLSFTTSAVRLEERRPGRPSEDDDDEEDEDEDEEEEEEAEEVARGVESETLDLDADGRTSWGVLFSLMHTTLEGLPFLLLSDLSDDLRSSKAAEPSKFWHEMHLHTLAQKALPWKHSQYLFWKGYKREG